MYRADETICAPATQAGGAISVIRISGSRAIEIISLLFFPANRSVDVMGLAGNRSIYGTIISGKEVIDTVILSIFRAPHSYTGEDSVEISCHGSPFIQKRIIQLLIENGCRSATPGEFTQRAFLNGKMDLSQAEAVADLVAAETAEAHRMALTQMRGGFSDKIKIIRAELLHFASLIELEIDFGEEDVEFASRNDIVGLTGKIRVMCDELADTFLTGNAIKNGIPVTIAGMPNTGKSTLLNAILMEERAIVSDIPGTTRDYIEDTVFIGGIRYRFIDTAGLRETDDFVESLGIRKTHEKISEAEIILLVDEIGSDPESIKNRLEKVRAIVNVRATRIVVVINKSDLSKGGEPASITSNIELGEGEKLLFISAREKSGIDELKMLLASFNEFRSSTGKDVIISNLRHFEALKKVSESLKRVEDGLVAGIPQDIAATDIRLAIHYLGEITGEISNDEILGNIFRNFCIGK